MRPKPPCARCGHAFADHGARRCKLGAQGAFAFACAPAACDCKGYRSSFAARANGSTIRDLRRALRAATMRGSS